MGLSHAKAHAYSGCGEVSNEHPSAPLRLETRPMISAARYRALAMATLVTTTVGEPVLARAQVASSQDSLTLGTWSFRPIVDLRVRGEYTRSPTDIGGAVYTSSAVLASGTNSQVPTISSAQPGVTNEYFVASRARLGVGVNHGNVSAVITLQDARAWETAGANEFATFQVGTR